jgi:hypothetical protein
MAAKHRADRPVPETQEDLDLASKSLEEEFRRVTAEES